jgi:hypothetical protein
MSSQLRSVAAWTTSWPPAIDSFASNARLLEQRLHAACLLGGPAAGVVDVLRGYRNGDGGFGHGLESDKRCPASLPIDVEVALTAMATAGARRRRRGCPARVPGHRDIPARRALDRLDLRARAQSDGGTGRSALPARRRPPVDARGDQLAGRSSRAATPCRGAVSPRSGRSRAPLMRPAATSDRDDISPARRRLRPPGRRRPVPRRAGKSCQPDLLTCDDRASSTSRSRSA